METSRGVGVGPSRRAAFRSAAVAAGMPPSGRGRGGSWESGDDPMGASRRSSLRWRAAGSGPVWLVRVDAGVSGGAVASRGMGAHAPIVGFSVVTVEGLPDFSA